MGESPEVLLQCITRSSNALPGRPVINIVCYTSRFTARVRRNTFAFLAEKPVWKVVSLLHNPTASFLFARN